MLIYSGLTNRILPVSCLSLLGKTAVTLLGNSELDTLLFGQGNPGLLSLTNHKDIGQTRSESTVQGILHMHNVEAAVVTLPVDDDTDTAHVTTAGDSAQVSTVKLDVVSDLAGGEIELDGIVGLDGRIREAQSASVVRDNVRDAASTNLNLLNLAQLVLGLFVSDTVDGEATLDVVHEPKVLASLLNRDHI